MALEIKYTYNGTSYDTEEDAFSAAWKAVYQASGGWTQQFPNGSTKQQTALTDKVFYATDKNGKKVVPYSLAQIAKIEYLYLNASAVESWKAYLTVMGFVPEKWGNGVKAGAWRKGSSTEKWAAYKDEENVFFRWNPSKAKDVGGVAISSAISVASSNEVDDIPDGPTV